MATAESCLREVRERDPRRLAFYTGRDQSQSLTGWWAQMYGTPNHAAHGGFCSVNMAAAGLYTLGGSFWEFGEPDFARAKLFLMFGVAEDHDSNPIKLGLAQLKRRGATFISVNPVRTGYSAIADRWIPIRPGTDGALVLAPVHELLATRRIDLDFLADYTNASWLLIDAPGTAEDGLFARDAAGTPLVRALDGRVLPWTEPGLRPALSHRAVLADGRRAVPVFVRLAERYLDPRFSADAAAPLTGIPAGEIRGLAAELARVAFEERIEIAQRWTDWRGVAHDSFVGRPVAMHAMRGISAHANGFQTCRALQLLQILLGAVDTPGSWRYKSPYPRQTRPPVLPGGRAGEISPGAPLPRPPLGFPERSEALLVEADGSPIRLDLGYSWAAPLAAHGLMHLVVRNAWAGEPHPIDVLFRYMANMAWNSATNSAGTIEMLTDTAPDGSYRIPRLIVSDAFFSETVAYADLVLPDTTYRERYDAISLLDRPIGRAEGPADAIRHPVLRPDRDVRPFQDVLLALGARLGLPGMIRDDGSPRFPGGYADYLVHHERAPGIGPLAGWRGAGGTEEGRGAPNADQLSRYVEAGGFCHAELPLEAQFFKFANSAYLEHAVAFGFLPKPEPVVLQLYVKPLQRLRLAALGHGALQPPKSLRGRVALHCDPLPCWHPPHESAPVGEAVFPLPAITQRPAAMYHSWGSQNAWLRQIHGENRLYLNRRTGAALGLADDDWVHVISQHGRITVQVRLMEGVEPNTVWTWNAIGKRAGAWALDPRSREASGGFLINHLIGEVLPGEALPNADPVTGQAAWYDLRVPLEKAQSQSATAPVLPPLTPPPGLAPPPRLLRYGAQFGRSPERRRASGGGTR